MVEVEVATKVTYTLSPLVKAVYGYQHFQEEHTHQKIYKPRFLRKYVKASKSEQKKD